MPQWTMVSTWHGVRLRRTVAANPKRQTIKMYSHRTHGPQKCLWYSHGRGLECGQESRYGQWSSPDLHREVGRLVNLGRLIYLYSPYSQNRKSLSGLYSQIKGKVIIPTIIQSKLLENIKEVQSIGQLWSWMLRVKLLYSCKFYVVKNKWIKMLQKIDLVFPNMYSQG